MTGQSFVTFLNEYRLNAAAEALQTTDETILTIASQCGFENLSYFNRAFKAHFGMTPGSTGKNKQNFAALSSSPKGGRSASSPFGEVAKR